MSINLNEVVKDTITYDFGDGEREQAFHVGYGIDDNYARCLGASIASFCTNNKGTRLCFHVLTAGLKRKTLDNLRQLAQSMHTCIIISCIDTSFLKDLPHFVHLPLATYLRFLFPLLMAEQERLLYLDADIICLNSADELFNLDLKGNVIAAVPDLPWMDKKRRQILGLQKGPYFNAGMLLIDTAKWNERQLLDEVISLLEKDPQKYRYLDQDALNVLLEGKICYLDTIYNCIDLSSVNKGEIVFLHFAAHPKPWHVAWPISAACNRFNKNLYKVYEDLTPWCGAPTQLPANYKEMKIYATALRHSGQRAAAFKWYAKYLCKKYF